MVVATTLTNGAMVKRILLFEIGELDSAYTVYCVTVTDQTADCSKVFCLEYKGVMRFSMEGGCTNELRPYVYGGVLLQL